jgi:hypothetical protein
MPKICYIERKFAAESLKMIEQANEILDEYTAQGFDLTLRQLYYQFVSRGLIANKMSEYKRLGSVVNDARLAGLIDWENIVDRTRGLEAKAHWDSPSDIIEACASQFRLDKWSDQKYRVEVWIEKDALTGVIDGVCTKLDVPYLSCRGYTSQSEMWTAAQRLIKHVRQKQIPYILHLGDHDPSGIDMSRDIIDRIQLFMEHHCGKTAEFKRLALNMEQVEKYDPPPNPTKLTDSRAEGYLAEHGDESWELDALEPKTIAGLIEGAVLKVRDAKRWQERCKEEAEAKAALSAVAENWEDIAGQYPGEVPEEDDEDPPNIFDEDDEDGDDK